MKNYVLITVFVLFLVSLILIGGCSKDSPNEPDVELEQIDLDFGGFTTSNEAVDSYITTDYDFEDEDVDDSAAAALSDSNKLDIYFIRLSWGMLEWDSSATNVTDWKGSASVTKGTLAILRKIRFENGTDYIIKPRPDRQNFEWESKTLYHFDGLLIAVIDNDTTNNGIEGQLSITVGSYSNTFSFSELDSMDMIEDIDATGNQVAVFSHKKQVTPFAGGFLEGRWVRDNQKGGRFWGRWFHSTGLRAGYLKGIWGTNSLGRQVFFGKYITLSGRFQGLLKGEWGHDDTDELGWFNGKWFNESRTNIGSLKGRFKARNDDSNKGFFRGRWNRR